MLFTATDQGFNGTLDIAMRASLAQQKLPFDRQRLIFFPIPTKFDTQAEYILTNEWFEKFASKLEIIYKYWLPESVSKKDFLISTKIPYITYFSFGEKLAVLEQGTTDTAGLGYAYENIASILANNMENVDLFINSRNRYIQSAINSTKRQLSKNEKNIFISYAKADKNLKNSLISYIKSKNSKINIWDDDEIVLPGENWRISLSKRAFDADIFIFLLSDEYYQSDISLTEQFFLQKIIDEKGSAIQIKLKKLLESEYLGLENKDILEVIQTHNEKEKSYLIVSSDLKSILIN